MPIMRIMAAVAAFSLTLALPVVPANAQQQVPSCPSNSSWSGIECQCDEGYQSVDGTRCVSAAEVCGERATLEGARCVCEQGTLKWRDDCLTADAYCGKTGARYDTSTASCVCPEDSARDFRTGACQRLPGAVLRARMSRADLLATVTQADIVHEPVQAFTEVILDAAAAEAERKAAIEERLAALASALAPSAPVTASTEALRSIESLQKDAFVRLSDETPIESPALATAIPSDAGADLIQTQFQIDMALLELSQKTLALDALRQTQLDLSTATLTLIPQQQVELAADLATATTSIQETQSTLFTLEAQKAAQLPTTNSVSPTTSFVFSPFSTTLLNVVKF